MEEDLLLDAALKYARLGYPVFPAKPGNKFPIITGGRNSATTDQQQIKAWWSQWPDANIGLNTDSLVVVDIDGLDNAWPVDQEAGAQLAEVPTSITPNSGRHHVFRQPQGKRWRSTASRLGEHVDTRAYGGYIIVPPSQLPAGQYHWIDGLELDVPATELKEPPAWLATMLDDLENGTRITPIGNTTAGDGNAIGSGQRNTALARLAGGMRSKGMTQAEIYAALSVVNADRCNPPMDDFEVRKIAESVARYEPSQVFTAFSEDHWGANLQTAQEEAKQVPAIGDPCDPGPFPEDLLEVPGLVGAVMDYIEQSSYRSQPILALASAISLMSLLTGRKVRDAVNTRPNIYSIGVAASGAGKESGRSAIKNLLVAAGGAQHIGEGLASHTGLVNTMGQQPSMIWLIDEVGRWLRSLNANAEKAPPHLAGIISNLMKFYTSSGGVYLGDHYADISNRVLINQPNVVLYGTTVPESLFHGLTSESIADGFLNRVFIFETPDIHAKKKKPTLFEPPEGLALDCQGWLAWRPSPGNLSDINPRPMVVPATMSAEALFENFDNHVEERQEKELKPFGALWARTVEKARKLALIYACSTATPGEAFTIDEAAVTWGCRVSEYLTLRLIWLAKTWISDGPFDSRRKRVLRVLRDAGKEGMTRTELSRRTQSLRPAEREEVIGALVQSGEIELVQIEKIGAGRPAVRLVCLDL